MSNYGSYCERLLAPDETPEQGPIFHEGAATQLPGGEWLWLPFLALPPDFATAIAYLAINQTSFEVEDKLSTAMADMVRHLEPEIVVGMPTFGMVLAAPVAKKLGHERYVPLGYSRKFWYRDEFSVPVTSITSPTVPKTVFIDPRLIERMEGKRVLLVEDVISTGATIESELKLMAALGVNVVGIVTAVKETNVWETRLAKVGPEWPGKVFAPIKYPLFKKSGDGWTPVEGTSPQ
jgi:adenine/guanine phosphoribosyltransferase-like PRPP-binding protein